MIPVDCPPLPSPWLDIAKTLVGAFAGAGLAFLANIRIQYLQRHRINQAAGNMALAILSRQYGDFIIFRAGLKQDLDERQSWPGWLQVKPTVFGLSESLRFELPTLTFLFEHGRHDLLSTLLLAETRYHDLRNLLERNSAACDARDQSLAKAGLDDFTLIDLHKAEIGVDRAIRAQCDALNQFLQSRALNDVAIYRNAGKALHDLMTSVFKPSEVMPFSAMGARDAIVQQDWPVVRNG